MSCVILEQLIWQQMLISLSLDIFVYQQKQVGGIEIYLEK
jgi:hypothetical protein